MERGLIKILLNPFCEALVSSAYYLKFFQVAKPTKSTKKHMNAPAHEFYFEEVAEKSVYEGTLQTTSPFSSLTRSEDFLVSWISLFCFPK